MDSLIKSSIRLKMYVSSRHQVYEVNDLVRRKFLLQCAYVVFLTQCL